MATIKIRDNQFVVEFEALNADGEGAHFRSFYTAAGEPIAVRQLDPRSFKERYDYLYEDEPRSALQQGIFQAGSFGDYLVFIDKLDSEAELFINWRGPSAPSYRRVALEGTSFHDYGPRPRPNISELLEFGGCFFIAWMTTQSDLILSRIDPERGERHDTIVATKVGLVTLIALAHIENHGMIVCHRAMIGGEDAEIDAYPVKF